MQLLLKMYKILLKLDHIVNLNTFQRFKIVDTFSDDSIIKAEI